jgi:Kef-type K+ transport system membrane component KefB
VSATWLGILAISGVAMVAMLLARLLARWNLPEVLVYLCVGIALGPQLLDVLSVGLLERSDFIPHLLLGFVAFMLGEYLSPGALLDRRTLPIVTATLSVLLPLAIVIVGAIMLVGVPAREAITLGILAMAGAPATVLAIKHSMGDRGRLGNLLASLAALDNVLVVLLYAAAVPFLTASVTTDWSLLSALWEVVIAIGAGSALGLLGIWALKLVLSAERESVGASLTGTILVVTALVASSLLIGSSSLVACAVAGLGMAVRREKTPAGPDVFSALRSLEHLVYVFFFVFAGTEIVFGHVLSAGLVTLVYILGRALGKVLAALVGGLSTRRRLPEALRFGGALLPQAGVVVGLAVDASYRFPQVGTEILSAVLAALVIFELVGPFAVQHALRHAPE